MNPNTIAVSVRDFKDVEKVKSKIGAWGWKYVGQYATYPTISIPEDASFDLDEFLKHPNEWVIIYNLP